MNRRPTVIHTHACPTQATAYRSSCRPQKKNTHPHNIPPRPAIRKHTRCCARHPQLRHMFRGAAHASSAHALQRNAGAVCADTTATAYQSTLICSSAHKQCCAVVFVPSLMRAVARRAGVAHVAHSWYSGAAHDVLRS